MEAPAAQLDFVIAEKVAPFKRRVKLAVDKNGALLRRAKIAAFGMASSSANESSVIKRGGSLS